MQALLNQKECKMTPLIKKSTTAVALLLSILLAGCSAHRESVQLPPAGSVSSGSKTLDNTYWWRCNFQIVWPEKQEINWTMDLLLAHAVVSPALEKYREDIRYYRFHRRAARDSSGHQFSFLFYSTPGTASLVMSDIAESKMLQAAYDENLITKVIIDDPAHPQLPGIGDTSDPHWSPALQRNWPSFIMGTSALWLGLIDEFMQDSPAKYTDIHLLLEKYREVDVKITETWRTEGQHALLHHLNAVFGYQPLSIRKYLTF